MAIITKAGPTITNPLLAILFISFFRLIQIARFYFQAKYLGLILLQTS